MKSTILFTLLLSIVIHYRGFCQISHTVIELDACPESKTPLSISTSGVDRKWLYVKNKESLQFRVKNVNPNSLTVAINGDFADVLAEAGGGPDLSDLIKTTTPSSDTGGTGTATKKDPPQQVVTAIETNITDLEERAQRIDALNDLLDTRLNQSCLSGITASSFKKEVMNALKNKTIGDTRRSVNDLLNKFENNLAILGSSNPRYSSFKAQLDEFKADLDKSVFDDIKQKLQKIGFAIQNSTVDSDVMPPANWRNNDVVRFTVEKTKSSGAKTTTTYDVFIVGGIKIDMSAGVFINGLVDENYVGQEKPATTATSSTTGTATQYKPVLDTKDKVSFAAGSLLNVHSRANILGGLLNFGISVGASVGNRVNYYAGGSVLIGRQQRIVLTGGIAWGKVKRLSTLYNPEGDNYYAVTGGQFATREIIDHQGFFGLTYNLGGKKTSDTN